MKWLKFLILHKLLAEINLQYKELSKFKGNM